MSYIASVAVSPITASPIRIFLAGVCVGIGVATFFAAELLRRLGKQLYDKPAARANDQHRTKGEIAHRGRRQGGEITLPAGHAKVASRHSARSETLPAV